MNNSPDEAAAVAERLEEHLQAHWRFREHILRQLLMALHTQNIVSIDGIHDEANQRIGRPPVPIDDDPNRAERDRWDQRVRAKVETLTREYACRHLSIPDIDDLVSLALRRERVHTLESLASVTPVTFRRLADSIQRFCEIPRGESRLAPAEVLGTRVALIRHFVSDQLEFIGVAKHHMKIRDLADIMPRIVGSDDGMGQIGGKAGGMLLANSILRAHDMCEGALPIAVPESCYLRSDVIEDFLRLNRLDEFRTQKYKPIEDITREYPLIRGVFRNGDFPIKVVQQLRAFLTTVGTHPLIVRSSSLLEDRFGTAFCGKYASYFLANQGSLEQRLQALLGGIAEVYASVMSPDPIIYRREHNLIDYVEEMAVLIQRVVGTKLGDYFLPAFSGVAMSRNEYRWSPRIRREDGLLRIVMGLGTRAVDRRGAEYPRMVALNEPTLRPESDSEDIVRSAQRTLDVIDLKLNRFRSVRLQELLEQDSTYPMLDKLVSIHRDDELVMPATTHIDAPPRSLCVTFDKLLRQTPFAAQMRDVLKQLEAVYNHPVDVEFACDGETLYVLQCRTLSQVHASGPVTLPSDVAPQDVLFQAHRFVRTGLLTGITHIVYVQPTTYDAIDTQHKRAEVARLVGRVNQKLPRRSFVLIGPGRWGSNDVRLGVPVGYADINGCCLLVEVARLKEGFMPEVSYGTHFFQDLVEADIRYLPLYPDEPPGYLNEDFLTDAPNILLDLVPDAESLQTVVHVIRVPDVYQKRTLSVAMDGESDQAIAFIQ